MKTYKNSSEVFELRKELELALGKKLKTPADFEFCVGAIWERLHQNISPTTLKRMWGYIEGADTTRLSTLNMLCLYLGYSDWDGFCQHLEEQSESQSNEMINPTLLSANLTIGTNVEIQWQPNRRCILEYKGANLYSVIEAEHSKLKIGDTFECISFHLGQPLYLDNLIQRGAPPIAFIIGKRDGLTVIKEIKK